MTEPTESVYALAQRHAAVNAAWSASDQPRSGDIDVAVACCDEEDGRFVVRELVPEP